MSRSIRRCSTSPSGRRPSTGRSRVPSSSGSSRLLQRILNFRTRPWCGATTLATRLRAGIIVRLTIAAARAEARRATPVTSDATTRAHPTGPTHAHAAAHAATAEAPARAPHSALARDAVPRLRLLIRRQHRDRIPTIGLRLVAQALHRRTHLFEPLAHPLTRRRVRALAAYALRTK